MGKYPDRASNVRALLTPKDKNCRPRGSFLELREKLERGPFAALTESSAERAARELNAFMLSVRRVPAPKQIRSSLAKIQRLASSLAHELKSLDGASASKLLGVQDP